MLVALVCVFTISSCKKDDSSSTSIATSYWHSMTADGRNIYLGIEEITEEDRNNSPVEIQAKFTNTVIVEIEAKGPNEMSPYSKGFGFAYQTGDTIIISYIIETSFAPSAPKLPTTLTVLDKSALLGEGFVFMPITKEDFYGSVESVE